MSGNNNGFWDGLIKKLVAVGKITVYIGEGLILWGLGALFIAGTGWSLIAVGAVVYLGSTYVIKKYEQVDPLVLDLNGDGINTSGEVLIDNDKNGFAELTAWAGEGDGILAIDVNNDGVINDGTEILGDNYTKENGEKATDGFDALADLDNNNDGKVDANDEVFNNLRVVKGDGTILTPDELKTAA